MYYIDIIAHFHTIFDTNFDTIFAVNFGIKHVPNKHVLICIFAYCNYRYVKEKMNFLTKTVHPIWTSIVPIRDHYI